MTLAQREKQKNLAKELYLNTDWSQKDIAEKIDVSEQTLSKWKEEGNWSELRVAKSLTRQSIITKLYRQINDGLDNKTMSADQISKYAAALAQLEPQKVSVSIRVSVMSELLEFVSGEDLAFAKILKEWQNKFIEHNIQNTIGK